MLVYVRVKPDSSKEEIVNFGNNRYFVYLKSRAENNVANIELLKLLSRFLGVPSTHMFIKSGATSRDKIIEIK